MPAADLDVSMTVKIPSVQASADFTVATVQDNADEPDGAVRALGGASGRGEKRPLRIMRQCRKMTPINLYLTSAYERAVRKLL